ncbi:MAG: thioredoxin domain-containing protein [Bacteroidales bacterium]|nr:thioredoxin domain-containing protein [Bacteroidales bacterium]
MAQKDRAVMLRRVTALLGVVALVLCIVMALHSIRGTAMIGCGAGSSCDRVLSGRWSSVLGIIPVAALATGVYLAILLCLFFVKDRELSPIIWKMLLVFGGAIVGSAIWFFILQKWVIGSFCKYCMTAHSIGIVVAALLCIQAHKNCPHKLNPLLFVAGLLLAGCLAGIQLLTTPRTAYDEGAAGYSLPVLTAEEAPVMGKKDAPWQISLMFDYQCSHCRNIHIAAKKLVEKHPDIAFVLTPSPLSYACNPYVAVKGKDQFAGSCELARLALAVWLARPDKFDEFDEWLFTADEPSKGWYPRTVEEATAKASDILGGQQALLDSAHNAQISSLFSKSFDLFGRTTQEGKNGIPRLVYGSKWIIPEIDTPDGLLEILNTVFEIPAGN